MAVSLARAVFARISAAFSSPGSSVAPISSTAVRQIGLNGSAVDIVYRQGLFGEHGAPAICNLGKSAGDKYS